MLTICSRLNFSRFSRRIDSRCFRPASCSACASECIQLKCFALILLVKHWACPHKHRACPHNHWACPHRDVKLLSTKVVENWSFFHCLNCKKSKRSILFCHEFPHFSPARGRLVRCRQTATQNPQSPLSSLLFLLSSKNSYFDREKNFVMTKSWIEVIRLFSEG